MASFFEKLKKGMDIKSNTIEEDFEKEEIQELPQTPLGPEEIKIEDLEERLEEKKPETPHIENMAVKASLASSLIKETPKKKKRGAKKKTSSVEIKEIEEKTPERKEDSKKWLEPEGQLVVDVYETDKEIIVQSAIAGIQPEDLDISIENDVVTIKGKRENKTEEKGKNYLFQECHWGYFSREIILPVEVDAAFVQATMKNGILTIKMPKVEKEKKKIDIK